MNLVTHKNPHGDELCAIALIRRFGSLEIKNAPIVTVGSEEDAKGALARGDIALGIGGGRFDEHGKGTNECAATLVATALNVDELKFFRLLEEVRSCDLTATARGPQLSEVVKALYDHLSEEAVIEWALHGYGALISALDEGIPVQVSSTDIIEDASVEMLERYKDRDRGAVKQAWNRCEAVVNNRRGALTELSVIASLLARKGDRDGARDWAMIGIEALFVQQLDFQEALAVIRVSGRRFGAPLFRHDGRGNVRPVGTLKAVMVRGENRAFSRAFRYRDEYDLLILRNPSGHVQVFRNQKTVHDSFMEACFHSIIRAEACKAGQDIRVSAGIDRTREWYFHAKAVILNGSKSHTDVRPTRLSDQEIMRAVMDAGNPMAQCKPKPDYRTVRSDGELRNRLPFDGKRATA